MLFTYDLRTNFNLFECVCLFFQAYIGPEKHWGFEKATTLMQDHLAARGA
jgi:hypothetical protein